MFDEGIDFKNDERLNTSCLLRNITAADPDDKTPVFHYHPYIEFLYILEGSVDTYIGNEIHRANPGDLLIIYPSEPHFTKFPVPAKFFVIKTLPDVLTSTIQTYNEFEYIYYTQSSSKPQTRIISGINEFSELAHNTYLHFIKNEYCSELFVRSNVIKIFALVLQYWKNNNLISSVKNEATKENLYVIGNLINHIKSEKDITLKTHDAARMCNMSDGYFSRIFRQITNQTFSEYIKSFKIAEAERLLKCTEKSITDISQTLNYATSSHFIEDFKKVFGMPPRKYRNKFSLNKQSDDKD